MAKTRQRKEKIALHFFKKENRNNILLRWNTVKELSQ